MSLLTDIIFTSCLDMTLDLRLDYDESIPADKMAWDSVDLGIDWEAGGDRISWE